MARVVSFLKERLQEAILGLPGVTAFAAPRTLQVASVAAPYLCAVLVVQEPDLPKFFLCLAFTQMAGTVPVGPYEDHIYLRTEASLRQHRIEIHAIIIGLCSASGVLVFFSLMGVAKTLTAPFIFLAGILPSLRILFSRLQVNNPKRATFGSGIELVFKILFLTFSATLLPRHLVESGVAIGWALFLSTLIFIISNHVIGSARSHSYGSFTPVDTGMPRTRNTKLLLAIASATTVYSGLHFFALERESRALLASGVRHDVAAMVVVLPRIAVVILFVIRPWILSQKSNPGALKRPLGGIWAFSFLFSSCIVMARWVGPSLVVLVTVFFYLQLQVIKMIRENSLWTALAAIGVPVPLMLGSLNISDEYSTPMLFSLAGVAGVAIPIFLKHFQTLPTHRNETLES